jgi:hypothetical protein
MLAGFAMSGASSMTLLGNLETSNCDGECSLLTQTGARNVAVTVGNVSTTHLALIAQDGDLLPQVQLQLAL